MRPTTAKIVTNFLILFSSFFLCKPTLLLLEIYAPPTALALYIVKIGQKEDTVDTRRFLRFSLRQK
jgi:hypothetical protein